MLDVQGASGLLDNLIVADRLSVVLLGRSFRLFSCSGFFNRGRLLGCSGLFSSGWFLSGSRFLSSSWLLGSRSFSRSLNFNYRSFNDNRCCRLCRRLRCCLVAELVRQFSNCQCNFFLNVSDIGCAFGQSCCSGHLCLRCFYHCQFYVGRCFISNFLFRFVGEVFSDCF